MASPRNRNIYQSNSVQVSPNITNLDAAEQRQIYRVQSFTSEITINRTDVNEYGQLARIDRVAIEAPVVSVTMEYFLTEGHNEEALKFTVNRGVRAADGTWPTNESALGNLLIEEGNGQNLFMLMDKEGVDANRREDPATPADDQVNEAVVGYGNGFISGYTINLAVNEFPTVTVNYEASNIRMDLLSATKTVPLPSIDPTTGEELVGDVALCGYQKYDPAIDPKVSVLRPGDVKVSLVGVQGNTLWDWDVQDVNGGHLQSVSIDVPMAREGLSKLGSQYYYARSMTFPLDITVQLSAIMNNVEDKASLAKLLRDNPKVNMTASILNPMDKTKRAFEIQVRNATIDNESLNSSIGSNTTVDLTLTSQVGDKNDTQNGIFFYSETTV